MSNFLDQDLGGSESEDDNFNPAPADDSGDEGAANKSDDETRPGREGGRGQAVATNDDEDEDGNGDMDDEEDEEDDEDDDDDEEEVTGHRTKRRKRDARLQFIDVEAEVDDEEEEDEEDDDLMPEETHPDDNDLPAGAERDDRRHRELDRQRELAASMDAEKQAEILRQRYGNRHNRMEFSGEVVPQRLLLPTTDDPSIWGIACKPRKEKEVVMMIQKRIDDRKGGRNPLPITSAFERGDTMEGWVYIEARKQADVLEATDGVMHAYPRSKLMLVPMNEMPDLLKTKPKKMVEPGAFVRITGAGLYAGDLAQVYEVESNGLTVTVRLVPRLDYGLREDDSMAGTKRPRGFAKYNKTNRPPKRLFSEVEAKKKHMRHLTQQSTLNGRSFTYFNQQYEDGYLLLDVKVQKLQTDNVNATLEESAWFTAGAEDGTENIDLSAIKATLRASTDGDAYHTGDRVEIWQGEQQGICGKATQVHNDIVTLRVESGPLAGQTVEAPVKTLRKRFEVGDAVRILGGSKHADETGMVTKIKADKVVVLLDHLEEVTVFSKDLSEATKSNSGMAFSKYDLYDLVQMDASTVGVIVKAEKEHLRVLLQDGSVRDTFPSQIANSLDRRRHTVATDRDGSEIRTEDTVKEWGGENRQGQVLYIHRNHLFVKSRTSHENSGVFVVRNNNVTTVAAKGGRNANTGPDFSKMNPSLQRNGANGTTGNSSMPPPKVIGRDKLLGKTVSVRKGPYKGLMGIVKDTTDAAARVELHSKNKIITIPKDILNIKDPVTGQSIGFDQFRSRPRPGQSGPGSRVPEAWSGSRTPMAGGATPGGRTPAWGLSGSRTPAWSGGDGGKTPAWSGGGGGRTPAWAGAAPKTAYGGATTYGGYNDGSRTAYGGPNDGSRTAYGGPSSSSRTPYGDSGSRTPAWSGAASGSRTPAHAGGGSSHTAAWSSNSAPTPGASYDAPTPGFSAPTPGDTSGPTPRGYGGYSAPTPGAGAPTPGAYAAETPGGYAAETPGAYGAPTPGVVGGDDDPRYE